MMAMTTLPSLLTSGWLGANHPSVELPGHPHGPPEAAAWAVVDDPPDAAVVAVLDLLLELLELQATANSAHAAPTATAPPLLRIAIPHLSDQGRSAVAVR